MAALISLAQAAVWCIGRHKERDTILYPAIIDRNDMRMLQTCNRLRLIEKNFDFFIGEEYLQYLKSDKRPEKDMFCQIDLSKGPLSQAADQAIPVELLPCECIHSACSFLLTTACDLHLRRSDKKVCSIDAMHLSIM